MSPTRTTRSRTATTCRARLHGCGPATPPVPPTAMTTAGTEANTEPAEAVECPANGAGLEPAPATPEALALQAELGIAPRAAAGEPLGPDDERFSPVALGHLTHCLVEVKRMLEQLGGEQKQLQGTLRLAHLRR
jgi:hypothetical protein